MAGEIILIENLRKHIAVVGMVDCAADVGNVLGSATITTPEISSAALSCIRTKERLRGEAVLAGKDTDRYASPPERAKFEP
jgi:hypothetical protein